MLDLDLNEVDGNGDLIDEYDANDFTNVTTEAEAQELEKEREIYALKKRNPFIGRKLDKTAVKKVLIDTDSRPGSGYNSESSVGHGSVSGRDRSASSVADKLEKQKERLPDLEGWLEKRKPRPPYSWERRWVVVTDTYILWNDTKKSIGDATISEERNKFNGFINFKMVDEIIKAESKQQNKLIISIKNKKKTYLWRCPSMEDRDYWVRGLKRYMKFRELAMKYGYYD